MVQKKKSRKVKKKKSKSVVYHRKQKQKQKHQKQSQSIVVHIHPKKTKSRPRFRNYSHKKAQEYFSSHYQTMAQSRAGYSLYNTIQVKKVVDALKGIKDKNAELREFYVIKYVAEMAEKIKTKSIGTSTTPEEPLGYLTAEMGTSINIEPEEMKSSGISLTESEFQDIPQRSRVGERGHPTKEDGALIHWLAGVPVDERIDALQPLTIADLKRRAELLGKMDSRERPSSRASITVWRGFNATF